MIGSIVKIDVNGIFLFGIRLTNVAYIVEYLLQTEKPRCDNIPTTSIIAIDNRIILNTKLVGNFWLSNYYKPWNVFEYEPESQLVEMVAVIQRATTAVVFGDEIQTILRC